MAIHYLRHLQALPIVVGDPGTGLIWAATLQRTGTNPAPYSVADRAGHPGYVCTGGRAYLLKPIDETALRRSVEKFKEMQRLYGAARLELNLNALLATLHATPAPQADYRDRFLLKQGTRLVPVEVTEIAYFFTRERLTFLRTWDGWDLLMEHTLDELTEKLNPKHFFRANRQFILHNKAIGRGHLHFNGRLKLDLNPAADEEVFISRDRAGDFRAWLGE